jgi:demethylmenaquinone methyltransferase / 2-methoxy-6-polyprenyl-1,4-benzoquinol methylase
MLEVAARRAKRTGTPVEISRTDLTLHGAVVAGAPFDAITMMFGARYLDDPVSVIADLSLMLEPGGTFVLVDFVEPDGSPLSRLAAVYFFSILPRIASTLAGHRELYDRLVETTHEMGSAAHLVSLVEEAGLQVAKIHMMGFGLVCGIVARRSVV